MDRLAVPVPGGDLLAAFLPRAPAARLHARRPRHEPGNLALTDGLDQWKLTGSYLRHVSDAHWQD
jgi:hypothetical protein